MRRHRNPGWHFLRRKSWAGHPVEPLEDDTKLVVRFDTVGRKTLRAKFAKLQVA
jgi:hypothetical protein